jgi:chorismate lyase
MHRRELPLWRTLAAMPSAQRTAALLNPDLADFGSLTARLRGRFGSSFRVQVLAQGFAKPRHDEAELLNIPGHQWAWLREVALYGAGTVQVRARSVLPLPTLSGRTARLKGLRERPLGGALFADPNLQRVRVEIAKLRPGDGVIALDQPAWARRSLFSLRDKRLLVMEVFVGA